MNGWRVIEAIGIVGTLVMIGATQLYFNARNQQLFDELQKERVVFESEYFAPVLNVGEAPPDVNISGIATSTITQRVFVENVGRSQATDVTLTISFGRKFEYSQYAGVYIPPEYIEGTLKILFHPDNVRLAMVPPHQNVKPEIVLAEPFQKDSERVIVVRIPVLNPGVRATLQLNSPIVFVPVASREGRLTPAFPILRGEATCETCLSSIHGRTIGGVPNKGFDNRALEEAGLPTPTAVNE